MKERINIVISGRRTSATVHSLLLMKANEHDIDVQKSVDGHCFCNGHEEVENVTVSEMIEAVLISEICSAEYMKGYSRCRGADW